jgi:predicted ester cyclase
MDPAGKSTGSDGDEQMMLNMCKAMPDLHLTIEDMIAEGDKVVCRNIWRWTDPSGKKRQFHERFNFATDFLLSELKRYKGRPKAAPVHTQNF